MHSASKLPSHQVSAMTCHILLHDLARHVLGDSRFEVHLPFTEAWACCMLILLKQPNAAFRAPTLVGVACHLVQNLVAGTVTLQPLLSPILG